MKLLYIGDVMGEPGLAVLENALPDLKKARGIDFVCAQTENLSDGKGIRPTDFAHLRSLGVDFGTGGNHSFYREEIFPMLNDPTQPIIRPANYKGGTPGLGYKYCKTPAGDVLVVSLLGKIVGRDADKPMDNPLQVIDRILEQEKAMPKIATVVNFHGDFSSEKRIIGYYLDGRVTVVVGDHWHVPTADADILPKGTAHMTDVGMCGSLDSSLGVQFEPLVARWRDGHVNKNELELGGRRQFNALLVETDDDTGLATRVERIQRIFPAESK